MSSSFSSTCIHTTVTNLDGSVVCTKCGMVIDEDNMRFEMQWGETAGGASFVHGQNIRASEDAFSESRRGTIRAARMRMESLAARLSIPDSCVHTAVRYFTIALQKRLIHGRRSEHVAAACLYLACRINQLGVMLVDFAEQLQTDMYAIGGLYLRLAHEFSVDGALHIRVPPLDPSLFVHRFASRLEFGEKMIHVEHTANHLIRAMSHTWINVGRRPAGIAAAALLLAARIHGFRRSFDEILDAAKLCDSTLRKRLAEIEETAFGSMRIDELRTVDLANVPTDVPPVVRQSLSSSTRGKLPSEAEDPELEHFLSLSREEKEKHLANLREREMEAGSQISSSSFRRHARESSLRSSASSGSLSSKMALSKEEASEELAARLQAILKNSDIQRVCHDIFLDSKKLEAAVVDQENEFLRKDGNHENEDDEFDFTYENEGGPDHSSSSFDRGQPRYDNADEEEEDVNDNMDEDDDDDGDDDDNEEEEEEEEVHDNSHVRKVDMASRLVDTKQHPFSSSILGLDSAPGEVHSTIFSSNQTLRRDSSPSELDKRENFPRASENDAEDFGFVSSPMNAASRDSLIFDKDSDTRQLSGNHSQFSSSSEVDSGGHNRRRNIHTKRVAYLADGAESMDSSDLSDDEEILAVIESKDAAKQKFALLEQLHGDFLRELAEKKRRNESLEPFKRKRRKKTREGSGLGSSRSLSGGLGSESARLHSSSSASSSRPHHRSSRINYEKLPSSFFSLPS